MSDAYEQSDWLEAEAANRDDLLIGQEGRREKELAKRIALAKARYEAAKDAKVGTVIKCAYCSKVITKNTYHKAFCTNGKTSKGGNCKDRYHNMVSDSRRERTVRWQHQ